MDFRERSVAAANAHHDAIQAFLEAALKSNAAARESATLKAERDQALSDLKAAHETFTEYLEKMTEFVNAKLQDLNKPVG